MNRRKLTAARLRELASVLSERDWTVLNEVALLRFVSADQLGRLCFSGPDQPADLRAARRTLLRLTRLGVLDRLPRRVGGITPGSTSFIYCLGLVGQRLSMERGWIRMRRARSVTPGRLFIRHALDVAELHTRLVEAANQGSFELLERTSEPACWRDGGALKPDSYLRLASGAYEDSYFIEVDRGTEGSWALNEQLARYQRYYESGQEQAERGVFPKVLWLATEPRRAENITELIGRLPDADRELFAVAHFDDALKVILEVNTPPPTPTPTIHLKAQGKIEVTRKRKERHERTNYHPD
ncbi:MAG TPA: replication-relaxation family protein [Solirubrobacterales bacterium]|nr:replication-relaxation family protein [Solirubrobacterales bacterium]